MTEISFRSQNSWQKRLYKCCIFCWSQIDGIWLQLYCHIKHHLILSVFYEIDFLWTRKTAETCCNFRSRQLQSWLNGTEVVAKKCEFFGLIASICFEAWARGLLEPDLKRVQVSLFWSLSRGAQANLTQLNPFCGSGNVLLSKGQEWRINIPFDVKWFPTFT